MKKLETMALEQLQPGMRVAAAVVDAAGRVLLPVGAELSEASIASLQRREIAQVSIELDLPDDPAQVEANRQKARAELDHLFRGAGDGVETRALYEVVAAYRMEHPK